MNFNDLRLDKRIAAAVTACGYTTATPIQQKAIPPAMEGLDVMGLAQTGTGKTAAFALPILERLITGPRGVLRALILAPTRELAEQIRASFDELGGTTGLRIATVYGGVGIRPQIEKLRRGVDIVVACPGRLLDHMNQRTINLSKIEVLVLDEADMMLDMGFLPDVKRILKGLPAKRQNMMFSATMPDAIEKLSKDVLHNPKIVRIDRAAPAETVAHALFPVPQHLKSGLLFELLSKTATESVLVFTRTKQRARRLSDQLLDRGINAAALQGNMSQSARQAALNGFRSGKYQVLVATDIAARGIDVTQVSHVINFDIPDTTDAYTHRIGRTGRALRTGDAFTLITREDEPTVRDIEKVLGKPIERRHLDGFDYNAASDGKNLGGGQKQGRRSQQQPQQRRSQPQQRQSQPRQSQPRQGGHARQDGKARQPQRDAQFADRGARRTGKPAGQSRSGGRRDSTPQHSTRNRTDGRESLARTHTPHTETHTHHDHAQPATGPREVRRATLG